MDNLSPAHPSATQAPASVFAPSDDAMKKRIWLLETHLHQAIQELRDAGNLMAMCDMPKTAEAFNKAAENKAAVLEEDDDV